MKRMGLHSSVHTHMLGAGQFIEFIVPVKGMKHIEHYVNCGHTNETYGSS